MVHIDQDSICHLNQKSQQHVVFNVGMNTVPQALMLVGRSRLTMSFASASTNIRDPMLSAVEYQQVSCHPSPKLNHDTPASEVIDEAEQTLQLEQCHPDLGSHTSLESIGLDSGGKSRPAPQEQLVAEVKGIYAGLVNVEGKCIEVDTQHRQEFNDLTGNQWTALVALHRTLLHEHHDFFLASQHPSANVALHRPASKYAMPARMWRHDIRSFLENLGHKLPHSYEHMCAFIYTAYSMMELLYETVPACEDAWIECRGDLARYRMAIEDVDVKDRQTWTDVARHWYSCASEKAPTTGRLCHHLVILAEPNAIQQLFYYTKSLCALVPFQSARESIMTLADPSLNKGGPWLPRTGCENLDMHNNLSSAERLPFEESLCPRQLAEDFIVRGLFSLKTRFALATSVATSVPGLGIPLITPSTFDEAGNGSAPLESTFVVARSFAMRTYESVVRRWDELTCLPFLQLLLFFIYPGKYNRTATSLYACMIRVELLCLLMPPTVLARPIDLDGGATGDSGPGSEGVIPDWTIPPIFFVMLAFVEWAGRRWNERRKWYIIAMALSQLSFLWLVEHEQIPPVLTACVFAFGLRPAYAYAMMDYEKLQPSPMFYILVSIGGFLVAAIISGLSQSASMPGLSSGSNTISIYLLPSMTWSMIVGGYLHATYIARPRQ